VLVLQPWPLWVEEQHTDVSPSINDLDCRKAHNTHGYSERAKGECRNKTPDLAPVQLQFAEKRKRYHENYRPVSRVQGPSQRRYSLNMSVIIFSDQSILKTSLEANDVHASSSVDHWTDTWRPHQNVSKKNVVHIAHPVKTITAYNTFRNHGIVGGMSL
jgi:hypothetical protein